MYLLCYTRLCCVHLFSYTLMAYILDMHHISKSQVYVTRFVKTRHNDLFLNPDFCIREFHIPKA